MEDREGGRCRDSALPIGDRDVESPLRTWEAPVVMARARVCDVAGVAARLAWAEVLDVEVEQDDVETNATAGGARGACDCGFRGAFWLPFAARLACERSRVRSLRCDDADVVSTLSEGDFGSSLLWLLPISLASATAPNKKCVRLNDQSTEEACLKADGNTKEQRRDD